MCGIAGFALHGYKDINVDTLLAMGDRIAHRGPDAHGEFINSQVGFCHRRLSILDLSSAGNQPMYSDDKNIVIVFNGEIYNFIELKVELEEEGVIFKSGTDTEVIIHLYKKLGKNCVEKLNGMFAFAIWDDVEQQIFMARDRIGKKPLYYFQHEGKFAFASEIKSLMELPDFPKQIRDDAVYDFFAYQYVPESKSIFTSVNKVPPGNTLTYKNGNISIEQYWDINFSSIPSKTEAEFIRDLKSTITSATKRRLISDVPIGAFLSGGVDSSGIVAIMAQQTTEPVKTCTIVFDDEKFNEAEFAKIVAKQYNTEHYELAVHQNVADNLEHIVGFFDEPFADPSLVPTFFVSELARKQVTVAIAGDGGDEIFAGYQKYSTDDIENQLRSKFPTWVSHNLFAPIAKSLANAQWAPLRKAHSLLTSLSVSPEMGFYITNSQIKDPQWARLASKEFQQRLGDYHPSTITLDAYNACNAEDHLSKILYTDMKTYLPGGILVKVDRMSMANSLEVRAPLLDKECIEFAATVPPKLKYNQGEKKYILKEAFKSDLPDDILYRKKMGFSVPLKDWFKNEIKSLAEKHLITDNTGLKRYFKLAEISKLWNDHQSGKVDNSNILWSMLMFEIWWKKYMVDHAD
jgi:asparagine synthase (glutamine-hydrolysing)